MDEALADRDIEAALGADPVLQLIRGFSFSKAAQNYETLLEWKSVTYGEDVQEMAVEPVFHPDFWIPGRPFRAKWMTSWCLG